MDEQPQEQKKPLISSRMADEGDFGNTISFVGNLGRDPEMSYTPDGKATTKFSVGVWAGKNQTLWLNVTFWEEWAEAVAVQLTKGMRIKITGRLRSYKWQGVDRYEVTGSWAQILTKRPDIQSIVESPETVEADKAWQIAHNVGHIPF